MNLGDSLKGNHRGGFVVVIPSFSAEHKQVYGPSPPPRPPFSGTKRKLTTN